MNENQIVLQAKGKLGRVVKVCQDGDMKILIDSKSKKTVLLSPACCDPVSDPKETRKAPAMPDPDDDDVNMDDTDAGDDSGGAVGGGDMVDDGRKYAIDRKIHDNPSEEEINKDYADMKEDITGIIAIHSKANVNAFMMQSGLLKHLRTNHFLMR